MNWKKINLFILLTFGISWTVWGILKFSNIQFGNIWESIIIAGLYMPGPAIATFIIQKFIYKESFKSFGWSFDKKAIKWLLITPLIYVVLILLTFLVIGVFGNTDLIHQFGKLDFSQEGFNARFIDIIKDSVDINTIKLPNLSSLLMFFISIVGAIIAGATINVPFMFGEEFGWRGLLLKETQKLGYLKSSIFIGIIWGIWHLPLILMGGLNYPEYPYFGIIMMCFFTISLSPIFSYIRFKSKSILFACMFHGMINGTGALFMLYVSNANELFSSLAGWAGIIANILIIIGIYIFDKKFIENFTSVN